MRSKSILTEARQIDTAVELIRLGARLQVLESETTLLRYSWILRNRLAWILGCQVMNQSVENGSWPLLGLLPATSLYRRSRRS